MLKKYYFLFLVFLIIFSFSNPGQPGKPAIIKAEALVNRYTNTSDTTYIINFWATWCDPCVKELPDFEKINEVYKNKKVKVILVSIDFLTDYDSKLLPFVEKKNMKSEIMLLNESKPNEFINKINPKWQGSIPSTMIINNEQKYNEFFEKPLTYEFLETKMKALVRDSL
jgi:thiol-disulfide isomerase/thioredoxin